MKPIVSKALEELHDFLRAYELKSATENYKLNQELKSAFKRYFALLLINQKLQTSRLWEGEKERESNFKLYHLESVSDGCLSLFLFYQGLYKPSFLVLRSGVENLFRYIGLAHRQNVLTLTSVFELIAVVKEISKIKNDKVAKETIENLHQQYVHLCAYVHTGGPSNMSLTNVVGSFPDFQEAKAQLLAENIAKFTLNACILSCLFFKKEFDEMHHTHRDAVYDILPKKVKSHLAQHPPPVTTRATRGAILDADPPD